MELTTGISSDNTQLPRPKALELANFLVTSNIAQASPENSTIFMGDFRDLTLGIRREASIEVLKVDSYTDNLVLEFTARGDGSGEVGARVSLQASPGDTPIVHHERSDL